MRYNKKFLATAIIIALVCCLILAWIGKYRETFDNETGQSANIEDNTINVGILFSETGTSSLVEKSMINAAKLAFDEINANGGVNGKTINYIATDYSSNPELAKTKIKELITKYNVSATVGCYSSASRQATLPVLKEYNSLLIYPTYTEGEEINPNVIYTGAMPNQQATEYIPWLMEKCGKKVFLIGCDYVFPVTCNKQAKRIIDSNGGEICGEVYVPVGSIDFDSVLEQIKDTDPDFIYCDLIGDSVISFYKQYYQKGFDTAECPIASITTDEMSLKEIGAECSEGTYASMNYFSSLDTEASREFVKKYNDYVTDGTTISTAAESTYDSCYLLAEAMKKVDDVNDTDALIKAFAGLEFNAPQGKIKVDEDNHCTWLYSRFAIVHNGKADIVYESDEPIKPEPWPSILYPDKAQ
ncbi:Aliphatic amidase expression-regulating protein [bioreactor metagenome]|uniref:Aliphatic amidase expression-regulating protein n=1 Tax=bioreactor metagenome TaxID=1076179 RepID=A0A644ZKZ9_9ZZZZ|nr:transporter substrate-binding domain-containing protein [Candidatus Metalachnospira sp.]